MLNPTEKTLFRELVFLMKTFFFVYVGISIKFESFSSLLIGLGISFILIISRIIVVRISLPANTQGIDHKDRAFLSMMIPRGLAAAVLATMISQSGLEGSGKVGNIVFSVIFFTIIFTSVLVPLLEKFTGFREFYIKVISFPKFKRKKEKNKVIIEDNSDIIIIDELLKENADRTNDEDDVPNIFL